MIPRRVELAIYSIVAFGIGIIAGGIISELLLSPAKWAK